MQKCFPRTIDELTTLSTMRLIRALVVDEMNRCTNVYGPKHKELSKLYNYVERKIPDTRIHVAR